MTDKEYLKSLSDRDLVKLCNKMVKEIFTKFSHEELMIDVGEFKKTTNK